jgi:hypothetical protein
MAFVLGSILCWLYASPFILPFFPVSMAAPAKPQQAETPSSALDNGTEGGVSTSEDQQRLPAFVLDYGLSILSF